MTIGGIIIWLISRAQDIAPTHFSPSGKPDAYCSPPSFSHPVRFRQLRHSLSPSAHIYLSINLPFHKGSGNIRQKKLGILLNRTVALFILGLVLLIAVDTLTMKNHESDTPVLIMVGWHDRCLTCIHRHDVQGKIAGTCIHRHDI